MKEFLPLKRRCPRCKTVKEQIDFHLNKHNKNGLSSWCKQCISLHRDNRKHMLWKSYSISVEEYNNLLTKQNGVCAVCGQKDLSSRNVHLSVDHDHNTHKIRGLLCNNCNRAIGLLKDDIKILESAIEYLINNNVQS